MEGNEHQYSAVGLTEFKDNFFPIGKGQCIAYLNKIPRDRVRLSMRAFNSYLNESDAHSDIHVAHARFQCIEFLGRDKSCEDHFKSTMKETKDSRAVMVLILESMLRCERKRNTGNARIISLED